MDSGTEAGMAKLLLPATHRAIRGRDNKVLFVLTPKSVGGSFSQEKGRVWTPALPT